MKQRAAYGSGPAHGTQRRYKLGCRCDPCCQENNRSARAHRVSRLARTGMSPTQVARPRGEPQNCQACGLPLALANPRAVWHQDCRPAKFYVSADRRLALYARDGWICQLCGDPVLAGLPHRHPESATLDHIVPRSLAGDNTDANLRLAHLVCNSTRGNRVPA